MEPPRPPRKLCRLCGSAHPELRGVAMTLFKLPLVVCPECPPGAFYLFSGELKKWSKGEKLC